MKNYIEIIHKGDDEHGWTNEAAWFAVRPSEGAFYQGEKPEGTGKRPFSSWNIEGKGVEVYDLEDVKALRSLLDAIEAQTLKEQGEETA